jgi:hypothetical protein
VPLIREHALDLVVNEQFRTVTARPLQESRKGCQLEGKLGPNYFTAVCRDRHNDGDRRRGKGIDVDRRDRAII